MRLVVDTLRTARAAGATGTLVLRADSAFHSRAIIAYPQAVFDEQTQRWISRAEVAELGYTAFAAQAMPSGSPLS